MPTSSSKSLWTLLLLLPLLLACGMPQAAATAAPPATAAPGDVAEERAMGDPNAPVTLVEYGDYQ